MPPPQYCIMQQQQLLNKVLSGDTLSSPENVKQVLKNAKKGLGGLVDLIYQYALIATSKFKPQIQTPLYYQQLCNSALELHDLKTAEIAGLVKLKQYYGVTLILARIKARIIQLKQMRGEQTEAAESYTHNLIRNDLSDPEAKKIYLSIKYSENFDEYVQHLNLFVKSYPSDIDAWEELGSLYTTTANYNRAAFCYEELVMLNPQNTNYYVRLAELLYTLGGATNLKNAKDYLCFVVAKEKNNYRALWVLNRVAKALVPEKGDDVGRLIELVETSRQLLVDFYKNRQSKASITLDRFRF